MSGAVSIVPSGPNTSNVTPPPGAATTRTSIVCPAAAVSSHESVLARITLPSPDPDDVPGSNEMRWTSPSGSMLTASIQTFNW